MQADRELQAERAQREQELEAAASQEELSKAIELSKTLDREASLRRKRESLPAEPPAGPDTTKLRLQLPNGSKLDRRFPSSGTIQMVRDYVEVYFGDNEIPIESFSLSTTFPRKTFEDVSVSLREAGLHPQSAVYVADLDA